MKATATITWITYYNYGTYLQAYALQQYIRSLGYDNKILDDSDYTYSAYCESMHPILARVRKVLKRIVLIFFTNKQIVTSKFEKFKCNYLVVDYKSKDYDYLNATYQTFICGSDQIWNPTVDYPGKEFYYANFVNTKKIAYAPSFGISIFQEELKSQIKERIKDFYALSCREKQGCELMFELIGRDIPQVLDPTLLLDKFDYLRLLNPTKEKKKYILLYLLSWNNKYYEAAKNFANAKGFSIFTFNLPNLRVKNTINSINAGPIEFLEAIRDATYVFTDSFHGSIFSFIFEVQFVTFKRFSNTRDSQNSRVENLFRILEIESHLVDESTLSTIGSMQPIDFIKAKKCLEPYRIVSHNYLKESLL